MSSDSFESSPGSGVSLESVLESLASMLVSVVSLESVSGSLTSTLASVLSLESVFESLASVSSLESAPESLVSPLGSVVTSLDSPSAKELPPALFSEFPGSLPPLPPMPLQDAKIGVKHSKSDNNIAKSLLFISQSISFKVITITYSNTHAKLCQP